ncbi:hypothetical protein G5I_09179 [Acromyrmex echinatior]|uniref:Uncharacterized protein n=1 Tax=Acromyrmex echinatior TaxID=103372 RepID=F4WTI1_ACREC|nr:hypothetical protein G5I_09179 [Acromyrmex echinatior]
MNVGVVGQGIGHERVEGDRPDNTGEQAGIPVFRGDPMDRHQSGLYVFVTCLPTYLPSDVHLYTLDNPNNEFPEKGKQKATLL